MIKDEIKNIKESKEDLRKFGLTIGAALSAIGILLYFLEKSSANYFIIAGVIFALAAFIYPRILKPLNKAWMILSILLGWFMSRVILLILYYLVLSPIGIIAHLFGKKFLDLKIEKERSSYWTKREKTSPDKIDIERQF